MKCFTAAIGEFTCFMPSWRIGEGFRDARWLHIHNSKIIQVPTGLHLQARDGVNDGRCTEKVAIILQVSIYSIIRSIFHPYPCYVPETRTLWNGLAIENGWKWAMKEGVTIDRFGDVAFSRCSGLWSEHREVSRMCCICCTFMDRFRTFVFWCQPFFFFFFFCGFAHEDLSWTVYWYVDEYMIPTT